MREGNEQEQLNGPFMSSQEARPSALRERRAEDSSSGVGPRAEGQLDQIREILFGSARRELERRLSRTDAHAAARAQDLQQESRRRTEVIEGHFQREIDALGGLVERELDDLRGALKNTVREQREVLTTLEQRMDKLEDALAAAQREMRHQLLAQSKSFLDELQVVRQELMSTLESELGFSEAPSSPELDTQDGREHEAH